MCMPRNARIDIGGGLYHVIARGVERCAVFRTDTDRADFLGRLERRLGEEDLTPCADLGVVVMPPACRAAEQSGSRRGG